MNKFCLALCAGICIMSASASVIDVTEFDYAGPFAVYRPHHIDSVDVNSKKFEAGQLVDTHLSLNPSDSRRITINGTAPGSDADNALHTLAFSIENTRYTKADIKVTGLKNYRLFIDGKQHQGGETALQPATHRVVIKYLSHKGVNDSLKVSINAADNAELSLRNDGQRLYTLADVLHGSRITGASLSPDGKWLITNYSHTAEGGNTEWSSTLTDMSTGRKTDPGAANIAWMPKSNRYYMTRNTINGRDLVSVDPATGAENILAADIPEGWFRIAPTEDFLIYTITTEGPKEDPSVYQVLEPEDRQPGWRNRTSVARYDIASGLMQPLTFGHHNVWAADISADGSKVLLMTSRSRLTKRPTTVFSIDVLDLATMKTERIAENDGFISSARFSPDADKVLVCGTPESFSSVGNTVPDGRTPSMTDNQLYIINVADKTVKPLTASFDPSIQQFEWNRADGNIYFTAENRDRYSLYRANPSTGAIAEIATPEDLVKGFTLAAAAPAAAWYGQSASNPDVLYSLNTKTLKNTVLERPSQKRLADVKLGTCEAWSFKNSRGDSIHGRFYLPPDFDATKRYPLIVNYYGGCSPTSRNFESRYPHHAYAALGYVVYVIVPSGATGFGQEFASRHVNTAGDGVAQDIIEGTKQFCKEHPYVNDKKIGCIGASYGGFMTQYLQTVTDIFAAAISHAGISDHTSYWGEGYWGYSYSEVSMANSYPWTRPDLYVNQSPLFNAHKINTPLLFLHGDKDNNVPVGESIQMFTALKLLGRETAFVAVKDQDHHITDYDKRIKWQNTIFAWFAKYLQDDPTWWNAIYEPKSL